MHKIVLKIVIIALSISLLTACSGKHSDGEDKIKINEDKQAITESNTIENDENFATEGLIGIWTTNVEDDSYGMVYTMYIEQDGSFMTNDYELFDYDDIVYAQWLEGTWTIEEDQIYFNLENTIRTIEMENDIEETDINDAKTVVKSLTSDLEDANLESFELDNRRYVKYEYGNSKVVNKEEHGFSGNWERTNIHRATGGYISILEANNKVVFFSASLMAGGHMGEIAGMAKIISDDEALYIHDVRGGEADSELIYISFKIVDDLLEVTCNNNLYLGFGMNVVMDGEYTQGEPVYTNQDIVIETFGTEERRMQMKDFLGEERWNFLEFVMEYGYDFVDESLTYSGFVSGMGQGADFLMTEDNKIYYLSYGDDSTNTYYTNDSAYKYKIPSCLMDQVRSYNDMKFVYKNAEDESITDQYVWVRGYYEQPESYSGADTIHWDSGEGSEWIEITIKGRVQNLNLITLKQKDPQSELVLDEILDHIDVIEDKKVLVRATQVEGIPNKAITFEDDEGHTYRYDIEEKSLVGEDKYPNQQVFPID